MRFKTGVACASALQALVGYAHGQASSTFSEQGVPTGKPIEGDYNGHYRPQVHFSPPKGFMNDPNGMFLDAEGTYHLYYQYNPSGLVAANQHWGHATSKDLYTWVNQPIALYPDSKDATIFSGSAVVDANNTSGFFPNQTNGVVAIYTVNSPEEQNQNIAYSTDGGYTFTKYAKNPVLSANSKNFRDPKVIWHEETQRWVMIVALTLEHVLQFYTSKNLADWEFASNFSNHGLLGLQYECPNLVQVPVAKKGGILSTPVDSSDLGDLDDPMWMIYVSNQPGAPLGGSISQYFPGYFNGTHFTAVDGGMRLTDFSKDNYAGLFFYGLDPKKPAISIAWASNWQYCNQAPTDGEGFRSAMSLPRSHVLANTTSNNWALISMPHDLSSQYTSQKPLSQSSDLANSSMAVPFAQTAPSGALAFTVTASNLSDDPAKPPLGWFNFTLLASATGETLRGGYTFDNAGTFVLDRGGLRGGGFDANPYFTDKFSVTHVYDPVSRRLSYTAVIDRSVFEVFVDGGVHVGTATVYPEGELDVLVLGSSGVSPGVQVEAEVWALKSTWAAQGGSEVKGNVTQVRREAGVEEDVRAYLS